MTSQTGSTDSWSLVISLSGCLVTLIGMLKLLLNSYFKKATALEELKTKNNEEAIENLDKVVTTHAGMLVDHAKGMQALRGDLSKTDVMIQSLEETCDNMAIELGDFKRQKQKVDVLETEVKEIKDVYLFIKDKIKK